MSDIENVIIQFVSSPNTSTSDEQNNSQIGSQIHVPISLNSTQLQQLVNDLLQNEDPLPYSFFINGHEVHEDLNATIQNNKISTEGVLEVIFEPQASFRVRPITRCAASIEGHTEAVLSVSFSPDGSRLASGSGDSTVRVWDINTKTPEFTCKGHHKWVLCVAWSPDGKFFGSGSMDRELRIWNATTTKLERVLSGHKNYITSISWEPIHKTGEVVHVASGSKDGTVRIWNIRTGLTVRSLGGHTMSVTNVKWGANGVIYSASQDRTIIMHSDEDGRQLRKLTGHAHWVNYLSLSTDYALRCGIFHPELEVKDPTAPLPTNPAEVKARAEKVYKIVQGKDTEERLVSCSDDYTIILWNPSSAKNPIVARITGHQQPVNMVQFSPDGRYFASASFDKSVKLWNGITGAFISTFRGHVGAVYQVSWSADCRMLVSASKDSTMKVWDITKKAIKFDLPGHADEVFAVDWSPDGMSVASGSKDRFVKIWCN